MERLTGVVPEEHYMLEDGLYVLLRGSARVFATPVVAVLVDTRRVVLVTHGAPACVRHELDELRRCSVSTGAGPDDDWLLLEGRPWVERLNDALQDPGDLLALGEAFTASHANEALSIARDLLARIARSG